MPGKRRAGNRRRSHVTVASAEPETNAVDTFVAKMAAGLHSSVAVVVVVQNKVALLWAKEVGSIETHPFFTIIYCLLQHYVLVSLVPSRAI